LSEHGQDLDFIFYKVLSLVKCKTDSDSEGVGVVVNLREENIATPTPSHTLMLCC
jgi:hypothetical protein